MKNIKICIHILKLLILLKLVLFIQCSNNVRDVPPRDSRIYKFGS